MLYLVNEPKTKWLDWLLQSKVYSKPFICCHTCKDWVTRHILPAKVWPPRQCCLREGSWCKGHWALTWPSYSIVCFLSPSFFHYHASHPDEDLFSGGGEMLRFHMGYEVETKILKFKFPFDLFSQYGVEPLLTTKLMSISLNNMNPWLWFFLLLSSLNDTALMKLNLHNVNIN